MSAVIFYNQWSESCPHRSCRLGMPLDNVSLFIASGFLARTEVGAVCTAHGLAVIGLLIALGTPSAEPIASVHAAEVIPIGAWRTAASAM